jgi:hypothetical protein
VKEGKWKDQTSRREQLERSEQWKRATGRIRTVEESNWKDQTSEREQLERSKR